MKLDNLLKYFLFTLVLFAGTGIVKSQDEDDFKTYFAIGFHGGYDFADVDIKSGYSNSGISYKGISTYSGGISLIYVNTKYLGVQLEANMVTRGFKEINTTDKYTYYREMNYLEIPFMTHLSIGQKLVRFNFNIGPYVAFNQGFSETFEVSTGGTKPVQDTTNYIGLPVDREVDYGFIADAGIGLNTAFGVFLFYGRYTIGVRDIFDPYPDGPYRYSKIANINLGLAYYFPFYLGK